MASGQWTASISYDANWGDRPVEYNGGPRTFHPVRVARILNTMPVSNGIVYPLSEVRAKQVSDGLSKTYLVGDSFYWITGNTDNPNGKGMHTPLSSYYVSNGYEPPLRDMLPGPTVERHNDRWGSAHPTIWNIAFCDGSVHAMSYDIDPEVHRRFANRQDGLTAGDPF